MADINIKIIFKMFFSSNVNMSFVKKFMKMLNG